jgi:hypothetical protein
MFCSETVPLARMKKVIYGTDEIIKADIEISHFGPNPKYNSTILCQLKNIEGKTIHQQVFIKDTINIGNCIPVGTFAFDPAGIMKAEKLTLDVSLENTPYRNKWDFWIYPVLNEIDMGNVLVTDKIDKNCYETLRKGGSVLLLTYGKVAKDKGAQVAIGFSSIFWNTAWTNNQAPHTLGILCDPKKPVFREFPTEFHTNWQWWDPVTHSQAMILDGFPADLKPLIQPIDTWFENRKLVLAFEVKAGGGKMMVCSIDLKDVSDERLASKQLLFSMLNYMNSDKFDPKVNIDINQVRNLMEN